jgi:hypothetical protein
MNFFEDNGKAPLRPLEINQIGLRRCGMTRVLVAGRKIVSPAVRRKFKEKKGDELAHAEKKTVKLRRIEAAWREQCELEV